ncbi:hypothetical protein SCG7086_AP_00080 [Chlamydiales bacterium SCGC AG-110-P3]|nr:hypothetical protein SCG7086_AP_00080 [Chlamydiales bacterium SCGC AG-110-P3]
MLISTLKLIIFIFTIYPLLANSEIVSPLSITNEFVRLSESSSGGTEPAPKGANEFSADWDDSDAQDHTFSAEWTEEDDSQQTGQEGDGEKELGL